MALAPWVLPVQLSPTDLQTVESCADEFEAFHSTKHPSTSSNMMLLFARKVEFGWVALLLNVSVALHNRRLDPRRIYAQH